MQKLQFPTHEDELLKLGKNLCTSLIWREYLSGSLLTVDHAELGQLGNFPAILRIHTQTGCNCRERSIRAVDLQFLDK